MNIAEYLVTYRENNNMSPSHIAAFIGLSNYPWYRDLESDDTEIITLDLIQFIRICVLFDMNVLQLPDSLNEIMEKDYPAITIYTLNITEEQVRDKYGYINLTGYLNTFIKIDEKISDEIGWDLEMFDRCLSSDIQFLTIPFPAFIDFCNYFQIDYRKILEILLIALGHASS